MYNTDAFYHGLCLSGRAMVLVSPEITGEVGKVPGMYQVPKCSGVHPSQSCYSVTDPPLHMSKDCV